VAEWAAEEGIANEEIEARIEAAAKARSAERDELVGEHMRNIEKSFLLQTIDLQWREHLMHVDHLRTVIGLRGYGQRDPLNEFKTEAFSLFEKLLVDLRQNVTRWLMTVEFQFEEPPAPPARPDLRGPPRPADRRERAGAGRLRRRERDARPARRAARYRPCPPAGSNPAATSPVPAAPARSSSTATARWSSADGPPNLTWVAAMGHVAPCAWSSSEPASGASPRR
jgi:preprotein translocase subunit SecA